MLVELAFAVCTAVVPPHCKAVQIEMPDSTSAECLREAQMRVAQWLGEHPKWELFVETERPITCRENPGAEL